MTKFVYPVPVHAIRATAMQFEIATNHETTLVLAVKGRMLMQLEQTHLSTAHPTSTAYCV